LTARSPQPPQPNRLWATLKNTPRLFRLVWRATPRWLILSLVITLADALIPVAQLYVGKLIVDWVVQNAGVAERAVRPLIQLVVIEFALVLLQSLLSQGQIFVSQVMKDRFALDANQVLLQQAIALDLAHYERPEFHDLLNRAQQSGGSYLLRVLDILTRLVGQIVGLGGLLALLLKFNPAVTAILFLTATPAFWVGVRYSRRRFWMMRRQTPTTVCRNILSGCSPKKPLPRRCGSLTWGPICWINGGTFAASLIGNRPNWRAVRQRPTWVLAP
jgi:ATP-binding cassette subfamily B protein